MLLNKRWKEGVPYRTIAKAMGVNYRNVYDWINNNEKYGLKGIKIGEKMEVEDR